MGVVNSNGYFKIMLILSKALSPSEQVCGDISNNMTLKNRYAGISTIAWT